MKYAVAHEKPSQGYAGKSAPDSAPAVVVTGTSAFCNRSHHGEGIEGSLPQAYATTIRSPIALRHPSPVAAMIPDIALGRMVLVNVYHRPAPSAKDASLSLRGTFLMASSIRGAIKGIISNESTIPPNRGLLACGVNEGIRSRS